MLKPVGLDRAALRRSFNEKRSGAQRADFLLAEVERRLDERLEPMRLDGVETVLDLGCGLGRSLPVLARRFPEAQVLALDMAEQPLIERHRLDMRARRGLQGLLARIRVREKPQTRPPHWIAADAHRLPLPANSVQVVWSNLVFHWFDDPLAVLKECYRVLKPHGLLVFSAFGVDTCRELLALSPRLQCSGACAGAGFVGEEPGTAADTRAVAVAAGHARLGRCHGGDRLRCAGDGHRTHPVGL